MKSFEPGVIRTIPIAGAEEGATAAVGGVNTCEAGAVLVAAGSATGVATGVCWAKALVPAISRHTKAEESIFKRTSITTDGVNEYYVFSSIQAR